MRLGKPWPGTHISMFRRTHCICLEHTQAGHLPQKASFFSSLVTGSNTYELGWEQRKPFPGPKWWQDDSCSQGQ